RTVVFYGRHAETMASVPLAARKRTKENYARLLRRHSRMAGNFLEIGPDIGLFASSFGRAGSFDHFWLYEPNRDVHQSLADNFRGLSFTINSGIFRVSDVPAQSLSTAVMIHVLDHLLQPKEFLREVRASLEPGGVVLIVTHDCASVLARALGRRWPPYTLQHPQLFSERSLAALLQASGFDVVETVKTTNYFPLPFLMRAALTVFGLPEGFAPAGEKPLLGLKLSNLGTIARKPSRTGVAESRTRTLLRAEARLCTRGSDNRHLRHGKDEFAAAPAELGLLTEDLGRKVPRQQQHIIGPAF